MPDELLENGSLRSGLTAFKGTELSFVGISEPFTVADGDETPHALTVLIPKSTYDRIVLKSVAEIAAGLLPALYPPLFQTHSGGSCPCHRCGRQTGKARL